MQPELSNEISDVSIMLIGLSALLGAVLCVYMIVSHVKVYQKAGKPGWAVFVPVYNLVVLCEIAGVSPVWIVAMLIPVVNLISGPIAWIVIWMAMAERFGRTSGFGLGLAFLPWVFYPVLAFGDSRYRPAPRHG